jgi:hydrogenase nickel incorporation protein HypA/HybF
MHEYGITKQIIKISTDAAKDYPNAKITDIYVVVGELTGFIGESIQMYFDIIGKGSLAEGAKLHIKMVPAKMHCGSCMTDFNRTKGTFDCPNCGALGAPTDIGKEFYVENIEIDK